MLRRKQEQDHASKIQEEDFDPFEEMPEPEPLDDFDFDQIANRYEKKFQERF